MGAVVALWALAAAANAQEVVNPSWAELPAPDDMAEAYPGFAATAGIHGQARLGCLGLPDGRLATCDVLWEAPEGLGFGAAALEVAPRFRLSPRTVDGEASKSRIVFSVQFFRPEFDAAPPYEGPEPEAGELALAMPLAGMMMEDTWGAEEGFELDVDESRRPVVERIVAEAEAEFEHEQIGTLARALARVLTPAQIESMTAGVEPADPLPPIEALYDAGAAEGLDISNRFSGRVKQKYCALYACDPKWPDGPPEPGDSQAPSPPVT